MPRFVPLAPEDLTSAQRQVADDVRAGRRGTVPANVQAWLPSPALAQRAAALGEFLRYETSLGARCSELAILVVARRWSCAYEWAVHAREAAAAGWADAVIQAIARGTRPDVTGGDAAVFDFASELVGDGRVSDATYASAIAAVGEVGVTELGGLVGYYTLVAFTLNAREVPAPDGAPRLP